MAINASFLFLFVLCFTATSSSLLLDSCSSNSECSVANSKCSVLSPTCGKGTCTCFPGFTESNDNTKCLRNVQYGQPCDQSSDFCTTLGAQCLNGACTCPVNMVVGPGDSKSKCMSPKATAVLGDVCVTANDCANNFPRCMNDSIKYCGCLAGYRAVGKYSCVPKGIGSACYSDFDCRILPGQFCNGDKCDCVPGASKKLVTLYPFDYAELVGVYKPTVICYASGGPRNEGELCDYGNYTVHALATMTQPVPSDQAPIVDTQLLCSAPFSCYPCSSDHKICSRMVAPYVESGSSPVIYSSTSRLTSAVMLAFMLKKMF